MLVRMTQEYAEKLTTLARAEAVKSIRATGHCSLKTARAVCQALHAGRLSTLAPSLCESYEEADECFFIEHRHHMVTVAVPDIKVLYLYSLAKGV